ncbi:hypothetical protein VTN77DRAFT_3769 [Rasamsonia byssochlamydoides]|uniref:uncharacterized protein n=1 Tax=Rasamsonia byssochlamydoides TaxID=89139 RepID=UPI003743B029
MLQSYSQSQMIGIGIAFMILPIVFVGLRVWAKAIGRRKLSLDDYLIFVSLAFAVGCAIVQLIAAVDGQLGQHQTDAPDGQPLLDDPRFLTYERCKFAVLLLSVLGLGCAKVSILLFYRSIFSTGRFRIASLIMLVISISWTISFFFAYLFTCYPITPLIEPFYGNHCVDTLPMWYASCVSDSIIDILILTLPLPIVIRLHLPWKQKIAVVAMFLLGATVCAISLTRMSEVFIVGGEFLEHYNDETYYTSPVFFWTTIEMALSVVSACLPTLRPLFTHYFRLSPNPTNKASLPLNSLSSSGTRFGRSHRFSDKLDHEILMSNTNQRQSSAEESDNAAAISVEQHIQESRV